MSAELKHGPQELRERILDATLHVICERGMARTRTSAIAKEAGCSEGSIYRYFDGKPELFREVVRTRLSSLLDVLPGLTARTGSGTVEGNLVDVARAALSFYGEVVPLYAGLFADAELLADRRESVLGGDLNPSAAADAVVGYLQAEQRLGRVRAQADVDAVARLLLSSALGESFLCALAAGPLDGAERDRRARDLGRLATRELEPPGGGLP
ncbi:MAG TPA: TetR/AcrR family transcriptional regulator [Gaiellaceae bacterium]|nr:TetR/AcrR family transcriptional regulator [Gaiellaceae bacterium]